MRKLASNGAPLPPVTVPIGIDHFAIGSHERAVIAVAIPQRQARLEILHDDNVGQQILGDIPIAVFDRDHVHQRRDDLGLAERQLVVDGLRDIRGE